VQEKGCRVLGILVEDNAGNRMAIGEKGGIEAVLKAMAEQGSSASVRQWGCYALGHLAFGNIKNRGTIVAKGGLETVLKAMEAHGSSADVQLWGCRALLSVSSKKGEAVFISNVQADTRARLRSGGVAVLAQKALAAFPEHSQLKNYGKKLMQKIGAGSRCV
jgi:hypothetical protein